MERACQTLLTAHLWVDGLRKGGRDEWHRWQRWDFRGNSAAWGAIVWQNMRQPCEIRAAMLSASNGITIWALQRCVRWTQINVIYRHCKQCTMLMVPRLGLRTKCQHCLFRSAVHAVLKGFKSHYLGYFFVWIKRKYHAFICFIYNIYHNVWSTFYPELSACPQQRECHYYETGFFEHKKFGWSRNMISTSFFVYLSLSKAHWYSAIDLII